MGALTPPSEDTSANAPSSELILQLTKVVRLPFGRCRLWNASGFQTQCPETRILLPKGFENSCASQTLNFRLGATELLPCPFPSWGLWIHPFCGSRLKKEFVVSTSLKRGLPYKPAFCLRGSPSPRLLEKTLQIVRNDAAVCKMQICLGGEAPSHPQSLPFCAFPSPRTP